VISTSTTLPSQGRRPKEPAPLVLIKNKKNLATFRKDLYLCRRKPISTMEATMTTPHKTRSARRFRNRREAADAYARKMGWKPMTPEEKIAFDEAIRMVTNLD